VVGAERVDHDQHDVGPVVAPVRGAPQPEGRKRLQDLATGHVHAEAD
jgi:hypothetical protein